MPLRKTVILLQVRADSDWTKVMTLTVKRRRVRIQDTF